MFVLQNFPEDGNTFSSNSDCFEIRCAAFLAIGTLGGSEIEFRINYVDSDHAITQAYSIGTLINADGTY